MELALAARLLRAAADVGLAVDASLRAMFDCFAAFGSSRQGVPELDGVRFAKFCTDTKLIDDRFTLTDVDLTFVRACSKGRRRIDFDGFSRALGLIAQRKGIAATELHTAVLAAPGPLSRGTHAAHGGVLDKLTDPSQYTGAHKWRFDAEGRGLGLVGRDVIPKGNGHVPAASRAVLQPLPCY